MTNREFQTRRCPFCKEEVKATALRCKHCQAALVPTRPEHGGVCPFCKEEINVEAVRCKHCHADLLARAIIIHASEAFSASGITSIDPSSTSSLGARGIIINGMIIHGIIIHGDAPEVLNRGLVGGIIINYLPALAV
jgi:hypothetical protein